jgi:hypothetical protein
MLHSGYVIDDRTLASRQAMTSHGRTWCAYQALGI